MADVRPYLVLVVDDVVAIVESVAADLADHGFCVNVAFDGTDAVARAIADHPDLIVMDFAMPRLDGLAATRLLKKDPRTSSIPVLLHTGHSGIELGARARAAGCTAVVGKAGSSAALLDAVAAVLHRDTAALTP